MAKMSLKTISIFFLLCLLTMLSCNQNKVDKEAKYTSFEETAFEVLNAYNQKDEKKLNQLINKDFKIAILFRMGAHDNIQFSDAITFSEPIPEYLSYDYGFTTYDNQIKYEKLPDFNCDTEEWDKGPGIYCDTIAIDKSRSTIVKDEKKYELYDWSNEVIKQVEETEKISRKIIVVGKDGGTFIFFMTKHMGNWYLSGIDRFEVCSA